jgi:heme-degrading monooxygenase HmoA
MQLLDFHSLLAFARTSVRHLCDADASHVWQHPGRPLIQLNVETEILVTLKPDRTNRRFFRHMPLSVMWLLSGLDIGAEHEDEDGTDGNKRVIIESFAQCVDAFMQMSRNIRELHLKVHYLEAKDAAEQLPRLFDSLSLVESLTTLRISGDGSGWTSGMLAHMVGLKKLSHLHLGQGLQADVLEDLSRLPSLTSIRFDDDTTPSAMGMEGSDLQHVAVRVQNVGRCIGLTKLDIRCTTKAHCDVWQRAFSSFSFLPTLHSLRCPDLWEEVSMEPAPECHVCADTFARMTALDQLTIDGFLVPCVLADLLVHLPPSVRVVRVERFQPMPGYLSFALYRVAQRDNRPPNKEEIAQVLAKWRLEEAPAEGASDEHKEDHRVEKSTVITRVESPDSTTGAGRVRAASVQ